MILTRKIRTYMYYQLKRVYKGIYMADLNAYFSDWLDAPDKCAHDNTVYK